jgi:hypothetical protein
VGAGNRQESGVGRPLPLVIHLHRSTNRGWLLVHPNASQVNHTPACCRESPFICFPP